MPSITNWTIPGWRDLPIYGNAHLPDAGRRPRGVIVLVHGFMGYKDYGLFPFVAQRFAEAGVIAHRFNLTTSGITENFATFERPDLFELGTWNNNIIDIDAVIDAVDRGALPGGGLPLLLMGHSRGGVGVLLTAGRRFMSGRTPLPAGVISASAPSRPWRFAESQKRQILERGYLEVKSGRTGQDLRVSRRFLEEQLADPEGHDIARHVAALRCPLLVVHGSADATVPAREAEEIAAMAGEAVRRRLVLIDGGDHVFNTPNPFPIDGAPSPQLQAHVEALLAFCDEALG